MDPPSEQPPTLMNSTRRDAILAEIHKGNSAIHRAANQKKLYDKIPNFKIKKLQATKPPVVTSGPYNREEPPGTYGHSFGVSISTYPAKSALVRDGDPICDGYRVHTHPNGVIAVISDGCGWGERSKEASNRVKDNFVQYFTLHAPTIKTTKDIAIHLINALSICHYSCYFDKEDKWMSGTTTALGGVCIEIAESGEGVPKWAFVYTSIGDCKCFIYKASTGMIRDATVGNRMNIDDARDPGGRLGPYKAHGDPDVRNLDLLFAPCEVGDILILVSDGVHDNLDPQTLGLFPVDVGLNFETWADVPPEQGLAAKARFMNEKYTKLISECGQTVTPSLICKKTIKFSRDVTGQSRQWMEQNPLGTLETNYQKFPGKLDHSTCACFRVGPYTPGKGEVAPSSLNTARWPFS